MTSQPAQSDENIRRIAPMLNTKLITRDGRLKQSVGHISHGELIERIYVYTNHMPDHYQTITSGDVSIRVN
mgnify:CR=1 FL=1